MSDNQQQKPLQDIDDHKSAPSDSGEEEDVVYLEDEEIEAMDQDDDFQTINESEIGDA